MKKNLLVATLLIALSVACYINVHSQDFQKIATTGFVFLELPVTARSVAMGETGITMTNAAAEGLFTNPALISLAPQQMSVNVSLSQKPNARGQQPISLHPSSAYN